jgi:hypothetical protein
MKNQEPLNLTNLRKNLSIPTNILHSICAALQIKTEKIDGILFTAAFNREYSLNTDTLIYYAFLEYENTGKLDKTKEKSFIPIQIKKTGKSCSIQDLEEHLQTQRGGQEQTTAEPPNQGALVVKQKTTTLKTTSIPPATAAPIQQAEMLAALVKALVEGQKPLLSNYDELSKAAEKNWLLTSEVLGQLLGMSRSTISSKSSSFRKLGYEFEKVKEGSTTLWRVRQY